MTSTADGRITESLAFAEECLHDVSLALATVAHDPMEIQLPPLLSPHPTALPLLTPEALRVFSAMYLESELEQAGVISVVEILAAARDRLPLNDVAVARILEDLALHRNEYLGRVQRELIFARVFG